MMILTIVHQLLVSNYVNYFPDSVLPAHVLAILIAVLGYVCTASENDLYADN